MGFGNTDSYRIVNPSAANFYFDTAGNAITSTTQPKVDGGAAIHIGTSRESADRPLDRVKLGSTETHIYGAQVIQGNASGNGVSAELPVTGGDFATMTEGRYIMRRGGSNTEYLAGTANTTLRSGASDYGIRRSINARTVVRGPLTATAIRHNQWSTVSGVWTTDPTDSTNGLGSVAGLATGGVDHAANPTGLIPGELVYMAGNASTILVPKQDDYKIRTTSQVIE